MKTKLVGIAGSSCSGKTTLLSSLESTLGKQIATLSFDEYFIGNTKYDIDKITNFERPELYNFDKFLADLRLLKSGTDLTIATNSRESQQLGQNSTKVVSRPIIFVEGFLIFYTKEARDLFETKVYIDLEDDEILRRRFARSVGTSHWDSKKYIQDKLIPYHYKYVFPQRRYADVLLNGHETTQTQAKQLIDYVLTSTSDNC